MAKYKGVKPKQEAERYRLIKHPLQSMNANEIDEYIDKEVKSAKEVQEHLKYLTKLVLLKV
jgi:hypothetical protein